MLDDELSLNRAKLTRVCEALTRVTFGCGLKWGYDEHPQHMTAWIRHGCPDVVELQVHGVSTFHMLEKLLEKIVALAYLRQVQFDRTLRIATNLLGQLEEDRLLGE